MRFLLYLKHWQLFVLTWGAAFLMNFVVLFDIKLMLVVFPVVMLLFVVGVLGWIWAIATQLHPLAPASAGLKLGRFKVLFAVPLLYLLLLPMAAGAAFYFDPNGLAEASLSIILGVVLPLHLLSMACIFYGLRFAAKTLKSVELQREAHMSDYLTEFFMLWSSVVGVWFLQPRLNALASQTNPE